MFSDEELVDAACAGNRDAFSELARRYQERLLRFLLTRCRNRADAEDALQDTFINAYRYLDSFDPGRRFSTWIYRIAINAATRQRSIGDTLDAEPVDADSDPLQACILASSRDNLWLTARRVLSPDACTALWLRYVEDMPVRQVADVMQRSSSWAKVTLMRSRDRLEKALTGQDEAVRKGGALG